jgi:hypothetical protein
MSRARQLRLDLAEAAADRPSAPEDAVISEAASHSPMSRPRRGEVTVDTLADGTQAFRLRFRANGRRERLTLHERRDCPCGCGGGWTERTAGVELENVLARVHAGVWEKPSASLG